MRAFRCGDGVINPGEVCDDGNTVDGDGCNADVHGPGSRLRLRHARDGVHRARRSAATSASSRARPATTATPTPATAARRDLHARAPAGSARRPARRAAARRAAATASSTSNLGEVCDDGNVAEGDGCSGDCKIKGAGCSCIPGMRCTCPEVRCGNGTIEGTEKCDDGNATAGDGCSATCQLETRLRLPADARALHPRLRRRHRHRQRAVRSRRRGDQHEPGVLDVSAAGIAGWACTGTPPT